MDVHVYELASEWLKKNLLPNEDRGRLVMVTREFVESAYRAGYGQAIKDAGEAIRTRVMV